MVVPMTSPDRFQFCLLCGICLVVLCCYGRNQHFYQKNTGTNGLKDAETLGTSQIFPWLGFMIGWNVHPDKFQNSLKEMTGLMVSVGTVGAKNV